MGVEFQKVGGVNHNYTCPICHEHGDPSYVKHGNCQTIHEICAKNMVKSNSGAQCAFCREAIELTSLLSAEEILERAQQLAAERVVDGEEQIRADENYARELQGQSNMPGFSDASSRMGMGRQEHSSCDPNSNVLAGVLVAAVVLASIAGEYFS